MASSARALGLILVALVACGGDDDEDAAITTMTTTAALPATGAATATSTPTTSSPPADAWSSVPSQDSSCFVVVDGDGDLVIEHHADLPLVPASTLKLLVADAAPEDPRLPSILRHSDNDAARELVEELGGPAAVAEGLRNRSRPMEGVEVRDATGHDRGNRVTCRLLVAILTGAPEPLRDALPAPGEPGSLRERYLDGAGRLRAKTGSIRGVASLAGYLDDLTFAAIVNGDRPDASLDALVEGLLR